MSYVDEVRQKVNGSDLSQSEIGRRVGVSRAVVSGFARGRNGLRARTLVEVAEAVGVRIQVVDVTQDEQPVPSSGTAK